MESNGESLAQASSSPSKRKRKRTKRVFGRRTKKRKSNVGKSKVEEKEEQPTDSEEEEEKTTSSVPAKAPKSKDEGNSSSGSGGGISNVPSCPRPRPPLPSRLHEGRTKKINELISDEDRKQIELYYYVDLTSIDKRKVLGSIFQGDKCYRCKLCQTAYPRLDKCQVHVWRHFNMLPYVCYACDFKTLTVTSIRGHIRKFHLKLKPFKCDLCEKCFAVAVLLKEHMISHSGAEPHQCELCGFACSNKRMLASHMIKHKSEKVL